MFVHFVIGSYVFSSILIERVKVASMTSLIMIVFMLPSFMFKLYVNACQLCLFVYKLFCILLYFATKLLRSVQHDMNNSPFSKSLVLCKIQLVGVVYFHQY